MKKIAGMLLVAGLMSVASVKDAEAQVRFGPQVSFGTDTDFGVGARAAFGLSAMYPTLSGAISGDYFFVDCPAGFSCSFIELNANATVPLDIQNLTFSPYVGGGLNLARASVSFDGESASDSEMGLNLLGGIQFVNPMRRMVPFVEARLTLAGSEQFVLTGGILF
jgi:opacity protein-like surface antigen